MKDIIGLRVSRQPQALLSSWERLMEARMCGYHIDTMSAGELTYALDLATKEGWNPGLYDAAPFHAADPAGFFVACVQERLVGCISAVSYDGHFGFIGLFIVEPRWRGRGIGGALWHAAMAHLSGHTIGLDGVEAEQENYRRAGFERAWGNARFAGKVAHHRIDASSLRPASTLAFAQLCADDRRIYPTPRAAFLAAWLRQPGTVALANVDASGNLRGWGVMRPCHAGYKIGPLAADTPEIGELLLKGLMNEATNEADIFLDVPLPNTDAVSMASALGMQSVFKTARMYRGPAPLVELDRLYGITSFELG
ncbi:MAG: GNAT family N-acetyltransferase [Rhodocyclaceae bacterium]